MKLIIFIAAVLVMAGSTTAGPYVTNISSDGSNGLNIEKCKVELNMFLGVVNTGDCYTSSLRLATPTR